jgi:hypothetical protein
MSATQIRIRGGPDGRILRREGTAAEEIPRSVSSRVICNSLPQESENYEVSVLAMYACPAKLHHLIANRLENAELKFLGRVVTQVGCRIPACLQTVSPDDFPSGQMLDQEMIAHSVKGIFIEPGRMGLFQSPL